MTSNSNLVDPTIGSAFVTHQLRQQEIHRLQQRFKIIEQFLRTAGEQPVSDFHLARRTTQLNRLHAYWQRGIFPYNQDHPQGPVPCFIDREERECAVAHLLLADGYTDLAHQIATQANNAYIKELAFPELAAWVATSGLTIDEIALIQPHYFFIGCPPTSEAPPPLVQPAQLSPSRLPTPTIRFHWLKGTLKALKQSSQELRDYECYSALSLPEGTQNFTVSEYPTVLIHLDEPIEGHNEIFDTPPERYHLAQFQLFDQQQKLIHTTTILLPYLKTPQLLRIDFSRLGISPLVVGRRYKWHFNLIGTDGVEGDIQRIALSPRLKQQLASASLLERLRLYAQQGIWYDTVSTFAELQQLHPNDANLIADWQALLNTAQIEYVTTAQLFDPVFPTPNDYLLRSLLMGASLVTIYKLSRSKR